MEGTMTSTRMQGVSFMCHWWQLHLFFFFNKICFYLNSRVIGREEKRESPICFLNGCSSQSWAALKPGSPTLVLEARHLGHPPLLFPVHQQGAGSKWSRWDSNSCPYEMPVPQEEAWLVTSQHWAQNLHLCASLYQTLTFNFNPSPKL